MAAIFALAGMNAAIKAYKEAQQKDRDNIMKSKNVMMKEFLLRMPMEEEEPELEIRDYSEEKYEAKKLEMGTSKAPYERLAWFVFDKIVCRTWFETSVLLCILLIGVATGVDLETDGGEGTPGIAMFLYLVTEVTKVVFAMECFLKIIAEGYHPDRYFTDRDDGSFNTFDFTIVVAGFAFIGNENGSALGGLRMLRLVRLLTFVKGVPMLRGIITGLLAGLKSVMYIVLLLFLIMYLFGIMGCLLFGVNDTARFGTVTKAMLSLFQVSTKASWTNIAYTSWWGCGNWNGDSYSELDSPFYPGQESDHASRIVTILGHFQGFKCDVFMKEPVMTALFFGCYLVLTAWVVMSLFVGVISIGIFEAFEAMKRETKRLKYERKIKKQARRKEAMNAMKAAMVTATAEEADAYISKARDPLDDLPDLRDKIDNVLHPDMSEHVENLWFMRAWVQVGIICRDIEEMPWFTNTITITIIVVAFMTGVDADASMRCERFYFHERSKIEGEFHEDCTVSEFSAAFSIFAQAIFTFEVIIKVLAFGITPTMYFHEAWNQLDFFVVVVGYVEMSPASFIFDAFPVVVLRLLRLLRVFRLANALPRLRSIVVALISGFSAVGWVVFLILIFNYISGCMCMLLMKANDPFHFGSVGKAMFTIMRMETLDSWDKIMMINLLGCKEYPINGYPIVTNKELQCTNSQGLGWIIFPIFAGILLIGSFVLPTVLVGIVVVSFDEAQKRGEAIDEMMQDMEEAVVEVRAVMPEFFSQRRIRAMRDVFHEIDVDDGLNLDQEELAPFYEYVFYKLFDVNLTRAEQQQVFMIMDVDGDSELGFPEFVMFLAVTKQIERLLETDEEFVKHAFPNGTKGRDAFIASGTTMSSTVLQAMVEHNKSEFSEKMALRIQSVWRRRMAQESTNGLRIEQMRAVAETQEAERKAREARMERRSSNMSEVNGGGPNAVRRSRQLNMNDLKKLVSNKPEDDKHKGCLEVLRLSIDVDRIVARLKAEGICDGVRSVTLKRVLVDRLKIVLRSVALHEAGGPNGHALVFPKAQYTPLGKKQLAMETAAENEPLRAQGLMIPKPDCHSLAGVLRYVQCCLPKQLREKPPVEAAEKAKSVAAGKKAAAHLKAKMEAKKEAAEKEEKEKWNKMSTRNGSNSYVPALERIQESDETNNKLLLSVGSSGSNDDEVSSKNRAKGSWFTSSKTTKKEPPPSHELEARTNRESKGSVSRRLRESKEGAVPRANIENAYAAALKSGSVTPAVAQQQQHQQHQAFDPDRISRGSFELTAVKHAKETPLPPPPPPFDDSPASVSGARKSKSVSSKETNKKHTSGTPSNKKKKSKMLVRA